MKHQKVFLLPCRHTPIYFHLTFKHHHSQEGSQTRANVLSQLEIKYQGFCINLCFPHCLHPSVRYRGVQSKLQSVCSIQKTANYPPAASISRQSRAVPWLDQTLAANNYSSFPFHSPGGITLLLLPAKQYLAPCKSMKNLHKQREMRPLTYMNVLVLLAVLQKIRSLHQGGRQCLPQRVAVRDRRDSQKGCRA